MIFLSLFNLEYLGRAVFKTDALHSLPLIVWLVLWFTTHQWLIGWELRDWELEGLKLRQPYYLMEASNPRQEAAYFYAVYGGLGSSNLD
jgi:hypothetical protein